jgi:hypothetical protein
MTLIRPRPPTSKYRGIDYLTYYASTKKIISGPAQGVRDRNLSSRPNRHRRTSWPLGPFWHDSTPHSHPTASFPLLLSPKSTLEYRGWTFHKQRKALFGRSLARALEQKETFSVILIRPQTCFRVPVLSPVPTWHSPTVTPHFLCFVHDSQCPTVHGVEYLDHSYSLAVFVSSMKARSVSPPTKLPSTMSTRARTSHACIGGCA